MVETYVYAHESRAATSVLRHFGPGHLVHFGLSHFGP